MEGKNKIPDEAITYDDPITGEKIPLYMLGDIPRHGGLTPQTATVNKIIHVMREMVLKFPELKINADVGYDTVDADGEAGGFRISVPTGAITMKLHIDADYTKESNN